MGLVGLSAERLANASAPQRLGPRGGSPGKCRSGTARLQKNAAPYGFFGAAAGTTGDRPWHKPEKYGTMEACGC